MSLLRALHAELLKLKRTLAFRVIFVLPFLVALLQFLIIWRTKKFAPSFNIWQTHQKNSLQISAVFMIPLLITLAMFVKMSTGATYAVVPFSNPRALGAVSGIVGAGGNAGRGDHLRAVRARRESGSSGVYAGTWVGASSRPPGNG